MGKGYVLKSNAYYKLTLVLSLGLFSVSCGPNATSFSLMPEFQSFDQTQNGFNNKIDILFVVDNSESMSNEQENLAANFSSFISDLKTKGYDYRIAVTASDAYLANPALKDYDPANASLARFRDRAVDSRNGLYKPIQNDAACGNPAAPFTGVFIITPTTPLLENVFAINVKQCTRGVQDERPFSSMMTSLTSPLNADFRRADAFLAIVILSDEDDFSGYGRAANENPNHSYTATTLDTVDSYVAALDQFTGSTPAFRRYNVSNISRYNVKCPAPKWMQLPTRYQQLSSKTDGITGNICDSNFAENLKLIQARIVELSTQYQLYRVPQIDTIIVQVDGTRLSQDAANGWTYDSSRNTIVFHGSGVPRQGARIDISFIPAAPKT